MAIHADNKTVGFGGDISLTQKWLLLIKKNSVTFFVKKIVGSGIY